MKIYCTWLRKQIASFTTHTKASKMPKGTIAVTKLHKAKHKNCKHTQKNPTKQLRLPSREGAERTNKDQAQHVFRTSPVYHHDKIVSSARTFIKLFSKNNKQTQ